MCVYIYIYIYEERERERFISSLGVKNNSYITIINLFKNIYKTFN